MYSIKISESSRIPKYQQIIDSIVSNISNGKLEIGDKIPSINEVSEELYLSRDTVEKAYKILKDRKIITSVRGKGFYINRTTLLSKMNILFLINKPSSYKMRIYDSFVKNVGMEGCHVNLCIYHCDQTLFLNLLKKHRGAYDYYIVMPHFKDERSRHLSSSEEIQKEIEKIPGEKLLILDNGKLQIENCFASITQDYENDIFSALEIAKDKLRNYSKLIFVYPRQVAYPYPERIYRGFKKFCRFNDLDNEVIEKIYDDMPLDKKDAYITIEEIDLVNLIKQINNSNLTLGEDVGIISYNETPLKELLGITVISTNFKKMGILAAEAINNKKRLFVKNEFNFIDRKSL